jgi:elongation factor 1-beta
MADVLMVYRLLPESVETDLNAIAGGIKEKIGGYTQIRGLQSKDVAFGLKALLLQLIVKDAGGGMSDRIEADLASIPNVQSVELLDQAVM